MSFSSIIRKPCKCSPDCKAMPSIGFAGYNQYHAPQSMIDEKLRKHNERQKKNIAAKNAGAKLARVVANEPENKEAAKKYFELDRWFKERQKEMTGRCMNCGGKTEAHTKSYKCSIAHILPKAYFKSIATNENNWLELCFYGNSCHTNYDNKMLDLIEMNCFDTIMQKFTKIYPHIAADEKRRIPPILIEYLKTEI